MSLRQKLSQKLLASNEPPESESHQRSPPAPQNWYRRTFNQSVPDLPGFRHPNRLRGITSIKDLARASRKVFSIASSSSRKSSTSSDKDNSPRDGSISSPLPPPQRRDSSKPPELTLKHSISTSIDSLTPDNSGISTESSQPVTPGPLISHPGFSTIERTPPSPGQGMGQRNSVMIRKPVPLHHRQSLNDEFSASPDKSPEASPEKVPEMDLPPVFRRGTSSVRVPVPRRRSSLTALHLDSSSFNTPFSPNATLTHRSSTVSETIRTEARSPSTITPSVVRHSNTRDTLSPPLLSPPMSALSRPSSGSSQRSPSSPVPSHIHLPITFPDGPVQIPTPPLKSVHHSCYQAHRRMLRGGNIHNPIPCMTCGYNGGSQYYICVFCDLRICGRCLVEFTKRKRDLGKFLVWLEERQQKEKVAEKQKEGQKAEEREKENGRKAEGRALEKVVSNTKVPNEEIALEKVPSNTKSPQEEKGLERVVTGNKSPKDDRALEKVTTATKLSPTITPSRQEVN